MDPQAIEAIKLIIGSAGFIGIAGAAAVVVFRTGRIIQKFESMDQKIVDLERKMTEGFKRVDEQLKAVDARFQKLEDNIPTINIAITRLEVRLEERTLRTIDVPKKEIIS